MKNSIIIIFALFLSIIACKNNPTSKETPVSVPQTTQAAPITSNLITTPIKDVVANYLLVKNALLADKSTDAAAAGKALEASFKSIDQTTLSAEQKTILIAKSNTASLSAQNIGANDGKIEAQRAQFEALSKDMYDLVKSFGAGQPLYQDYCPMYNDNKGGAWLSEIEDIKNPYFGKKMANCGKVKEEIK
jgi:hypothetical protein